MNIEWLGSAQGILQPLARPLGRGVRQARLWWFQRRDKPPVSEPDANVLAHAVLAGRIESAIAFRNFASDQVHIAVLRESDDRHLERRIVLLDQMGLSYRKVWESERIDQFRGLWVEDIDQDGTKEVLFLEESSGTGAGSTILHIYSLTRVQVYSLHEFFSWSDPAGPMSPQIAIAPEPDPVLRRAIEKAAVARGLLRIRVPDLGDPAIAAQAWHVDNGQRTEGPVKLRFYSGAPHCTSASLCEVERGSITYIAFFKGPVVGHDKTADQHFVVFSPASTYDWAQWLVLDAGRLWLPNQGAVLSFEHTGSEGFLKRHPDCPRRIAKPAAQCEKPS